MRDIRKALLTKRATLTQDAIHLYSEQIQTTLRPFIKKGMCIGCYYEKEYEVQLRPLVESLFPMCKIAYPVCEQQGVMKFHQIDEDTTYIQNAYGILEPVQKALVKPKELDIILVPMVGFDTRCHRLGHGGGYYDRYLIETNACKIGLAFELQKVENLRTQPHDVPMDIIITESCMYGKGA